MERADTEIQEMTDDLFAWGEDVAVAVDCVGFDSEPIAAPEAAEVEHSQVEESPAAAILPSRRRSKPRARSHAVRVWFDDQEIGSLTDCAVAEGIELADFVRDRALRNPQARDQRTSPVDADLLVPAAQPSLPAELSIPPLPPEMERRINAYYASDDRFPAIVPGDRSVMEPPAERKPLRRLSHFFTALVGA